MSIASVVSDVDRLVQRRVALLEEIDQIDAQLERVRLALTATVPPRSERIGERKPKRLITEKARTAIVAALAKAEPQSTATLKRTTGITTAGLIASAMAKEGLLHRKTDINGVGRYVGFWYARTPEGFDGSLDVAAKPAGEPADESG